MKEYWTLFRKCWLWQLRFQQFSASADILTIPKSELKIILTFILHLLKERKKEWLLPQTNKVCKSFIWEVKLLYLKILLNARFFTWKESFKLKHQKLLYDCNVTPLFLNIPRSNRINIVPVKSNWCIYPFLFGSTRFWKTIAGIFKIYYKYLL